MCCKAGKRQHMCTGMSLQPACIHPEQESFVTLWGEFCHPDSNAVMHQVDTPDESIKTDK